MEYVHVVFTFGSDGKRFAVGTPLTELCHFAIRVELSRKFPSVCYIHRYAPFCPSYQLQVTIVY
jgi:hypothetical protein